VGPGLSGRLVVLCTIGSAEEAEGVARAVVERSLAACVNVVPGVVSFYRWKGEVARDGEWLMVMKTTAGRFELLRQALVDLHPYDVPEIVALAIERGHVPYLEWIDESVGASTEPASGS
jgi:periplasmic divalent cation tolerance protein